MPNSRWNLSDQWILTISLFVLILPVAVVEWQVLTFTHGVFSYPFDDTFIHMAIAKNIAFYGVWGISPHEFSSASSSVIYPLLLAGCFKLFGASTALPLLINLVAGILLIIVIQRWLSRQQIGTVGQLATLLALILFTPLPAIIVFGMEHTLQLLFDFLFLYSFAEALGKPSANERTTLPPTVYLYGVLVMAVRYEGMFLIALAGLALVVRSFTVRNVLAAAQLTFISFLPILIFGIYAQSKGSYFFPNSVLVKSTTPPLTLQGVLQFLTEDLFTRPFYFHPTVGGLATQRLLIILPLSYILFFGPLRVAPVYRYILLLLTGLTLLHLLFASTSILFRYEAYLAGCAVPILGMLAAKYGKQQLQERPVTSRYVAFFLLALLVTPLLLRSKEALGLMKQGSINIYEQQYHMGQFVHQYYDDIPVAMGDIGAISFYSHGRNLDLEGLGNLDVARSRKKGYWTADFLYALSRRDSVRVAIVFDRSYPLQLRQRWYKVATWQIPDNVACYSDVVSFYAVDSASGPQLEARLKAFDERLPKDVVVRYR